MLTQLIRKYFKHRFCVAGMALVFLSQGSLAIELNMEDKTDQHQLMVEGKVVGQIKIESRFVGEPVAFPVRIKVELKCERGYRNQSTLRRAVVWSAYDYGNARDSKQLSEFSEQSSKLKVFYWTSRMDPDGGVVRGRSEVREYNLSSACVRSNADAENSR